MEADNFADDFITNELDNLDIDIPDRNFMDSAQLDSLLNLEKNFQNLEVREITLVSSVVSSLLVFSLVCHFTRFECSFHFHSF